MLTTQHGEGGKPIRALSEQYQTINHKRHLDKREPISECWKLPPQGF